MLIAPDSAHVEAVMRDMDRIFSVFADSDNSAVDPERRQRRREEEEEGDKENAAPVGKGGRQGPRTGVGKQKGLGLGQRNVLTEINSNDGIAPVPATALSQNDRKDSVSCRTTTPCSCGRGRGTCGKKLP